MCIHYHLFCDLIFDLNFVQVIGFTIYNKGYILVLTLTTSPDLIANINTLRNTSVSTASGHIPVSFSLSCRSHEVNSNTNYTVPLFSKGDYFGIVIVNFDFYFTCTDIEFLWLFVKQSLYEAISIYIPMSCHRKIGPRNNWSPWPTFLRKIGPRV